MAKDLGTITHEIKTTGGSGDGGGGGGRSNTDAMIGSGRSGGSGGGSGGGMGGIGDVIRGVSRGGIGGGSQAMAKVMGLAKLAVGIGLAIAAFALVTIAVKKVVDVFVRWSKEIENGTKKFSQYNARLPATTAVAQVGEITRDIKSANVLAGSYATAGASMERIRNSFRPVSDAWSLVKANIINTFMPVLERLVSALRLVTIKILEAVIWFQEAGITGGNVLGGIIDSTPISGGIPGFSSYVLGLGSNDQADAEFLAGLKAILRELRKGNEDTDLREINAYAGTVGVQLTDGQWNPWSKPLPPPEPKTAVYDRSNMRHP